MKTPIRFLAFAAALPLTVMAQSSSSGSSTASGAAGSSADRSNSSTSSSSNYPSSSSSRDSSSSASSSPTSSSSLSTDSTTSGMGAMGTAGIQRLSQQQVDQQLTAKGLIGKNVYDNAGKRVGEVKDIVLDSSGVPQLANVASGHDKKDNTSSDSSTRSTSGASRSDSSPNLGRAATDLAHSAMGVASSMMSGPAAIISSGGFMGMGDNLLRVPLNQLSYDSSNDHLTLNVSEAEISSLTNDKSSRSAAE